MKRLLKLLGLIKKKPRKCETAKKVRRAYMEETLAHLKEIRKELEHEKQVA